MMTCPSFLPEKRNGSERQGRSDVSRGGREITFKLTVSSESFDSRDVILLDVSNLLSV